MSSNRNGLLPAVLVGAAATSALVLTLGSAVRALTGQQVNEVAREVTVFIGGTDGEEFQTQGSGTIVSRNGDTYYVLTALHVVGTQETQAGGVQYGLITPDSERHEITAENITPVGQNVDLALIEFTSQEDYQVATLAKSDEVTQGTPVFISGWPRQGSVGSATGELPRQFTDGRISTVLTQPYLGYQVGYTNTTLAGMSGGPVLDAGGRLVAVHGLADTDSLDVSGLESSGVDETTLSELLKTGFNYGIPTNTFLEGLKQTDLFLSLDVSADAPPELGATQSASVTPEDTIETEGFFQGLGRVAEETLKQEAEGVIRRKLRLPF